MNSNDEVRSNSSSGEQHYQVKNVGAIFGALSLTVIFGLCVLFCLVAARGALTIVLPLAIISFLRYRVIKDGISFDLENGIMSYPGGGVAANTLADRFSIKYSFQYFHRFTININEIRSMKASGNVSISQSNSGKVSRAYTYFIEVNGKFGSSKIAFGSNEQKRDEALSFIRQYNRMGEPIVFG